MMKDKELYKPIFTNFRSTEVPEIYHPTEDTDRKELDNEHKLLLAEGTLKEIEDVLNSKYNYATKIMWLKIGLENYHKHKKEIEEKGYLSLRTGENE